MNLPRLSEIGKRIKEIADSYSADQYSVSTPHQEELFKMTQELLDESSGYSKEFARGLISLAAYSEEQLKDELDRRRTKDARELADALKRIIGELEGNTSDVKIDDVKYRLRELGRDNYAP